jgi:hypothetical protein
MVAQESRETHRDHGVANDEHIGLDASISSTVLDARNPQPYLSFGRTEHGSCAFYDRFALAPSAKTMRRMEIVWHAILFPG